MINPISNLIDSYLEKKNLKYEDLTSEEKQDYARQLEVLEKKPVDIEGFKKFVERQIKIIEIELCKVKDGTEKSIGLKYRLQYALIMESYLYGPERAKAALEKFLQSSKNKIED